MADTAGALNKAAGALGGTWKFLQSASPWILGIAAVGAVAAPVYAGALFGSLSTGFTTLASGAQTSLSYATSFVPSAPVVPPVPPTGVPGGIVGGPIPTGP